MAPKDNNDDKKKDNNIKDNNNRDNQQQNNWGREVMAKDPTYFSIWLQRKWTTT